MRARTVGATLAATAVVVGGLATINAAEPTTPTTTTRPCVDSPSTAVKVRPL